MPNWDWCRVGRDPSFCPARFSGSLYKVTTLNTQVNPAEASLRRPQNQHHAYDTGILERPRSKRRGPLEGGTGM